MDAIIADFNSIRALVSQSLSVIACCIALSALCLTASFAIPITPFFIQRGFAYYLHTIAIALLYSGIVIAIIKRLHTQQGIRRLELQYLALICGIGGLLVVTLNGIGNIFHIRTLNRASILLIFACYLFMAWALAHHRIFNARDILASLGHRFVVIAVLAVAAWGLSTPLCQIMPVPVAWMISISLCSLAIFWIDEKTRAWLKLNDALLLSAFRSNIIHVSRSEAGFENLLNQFERLLAQHFASASAYIFQREGERFVGRGVEFSAQRTALVALSECEWITPESLLRRRATPSLEDLGVFLSENALGAVVAIPRANRNPTMLVAVGVKSNEWPFTYPDIQVLQNVAELMDNILIRSRLADQQALRARMEHMALMSRGLAHDLKNLLTPVSSFLMHTEGRYENGSAEAEVHAQARRSIRIVTDYLREALFFSDRLEPKYEAVDLARVFARVCTANSTRAASRGVLLSTNQQYNGHLFGDDVLLQRMLSNLVGNAIDASEAGQTVTLTATTVQPGWLRLLVTDVGCGIPTATLERIFEPYFTTKQFGEDVRGFGLGLPIAQRIAHLHGGTIAVRSAPGRGTDVTVEVPLDPKGVAAPPPHNQDPT